MSTTVDSRNIGHTLTPPTEAAVANNAAAKTLRIEEAELVLLKLKLYTALVVWRSMLREAKRNQSWRICHAVTAIRKETCLSKPTILKAQKDLVSLGYATILSGGGGSRQPITFGLTPITGITLKPPQT